MTPLLIIAVVAVLPVVLALFLGVNSVLLFLSVVVGYLLQQVLSDSAGLVLSGFVKGSSDMVASILLLSLPVVLSLVVLRKSAKPSTLVLQLAPLALTGATFGYIVLGVLGGDFQAKVYASQFGPGIKQASDVVIALAAVLNLLLAWRLYRHKPDGKHGKHH